MQSKFFVVLAALFAVTYVQAQGGVISSLISGRASSAVASITGGSQTSGATSASSISSASSQISSATSSGSASGVTSSATGSATSAVGSASSSNGGILSSLRATATSIGQSGSAANALTDGYSNTLLVQVAALAALFVASFVVMLA